MGPTYANAFPERKFSAFTPWMAAGVLLWAGCGGGGAAGNTGTAPASGERAAPQAPRAEPPPSAHRALGATATFADLVAAAAALDGADAGDSDAGCLLGGGASPAAGYRLAADLAVALRPVPSPPEDLATRLEAETGPVAVLSRWGQRGPRGSGLAVATLTHMPPPDGPIALLALTEGGLHLRATEPLPGLPAGPIPWEDAEQILARLPPTVDTLLVTAAAGLPLARLRTALAALPAGAPPVALAVALSSATQLPEPVDAETAGAPLCPEGLPALSAGTAEGGMDPAQAAPVLRPLGERTRRCFRAFPEAARGGRMVVHLRVGPDGTVRQACMASDSVGSAGLRRCLLDHLRGLRFPAPDPAGAVDLSFPITVEGSPGTRQRPLCKPTP